MTAGQSRADIGVFLHSPSGGGAQRRTVTLLNGFAERGYQVELVVVTANGVLRPDIDRRVRIVELTNWSDGHPLARLPRRLQLLLAVPRLARHLRGNCAGVLLSAASHLHVPVLLARRLARSPIPVVLRMSNHFGRTRIEGARVDRKLWAKLVVARLYRDSRAAIAVSEGVARDLVSAAGYPSDRIETIYNPVLCDDLAERAAMPLHHPWFEAGQPPVILAVGRVVRQKDLPTLVRAFARVREQRPVRLMILGKSKNGRTQRELDHLIDELGVAADVQFAGYVDNPARYMKRAGLLALSSAWEGLPGVLLEALACGCPVVSTDCPSGPWEILEGGRFGALVPVGDYAALADAILATLDAPPDREILLARAREFGLARAVDRYVSFLLAARDHPLPGPMHARSPEPAVKRNP